MEAHLTDEVRDAIDEYGHQFILNNAITVLININPIAPTPKKMIQMNWLQPQSALGGRSLVQFMIGNKNLKERLNNEVLA